MTGLRILVVRLGAMGDIFHALPAVASLKQSFPHSELTWAVDRKWADLLEGNPFVDHAALAQLQPSVVAATLLGLEWNSIVFALGKPTNEYDDGTTVQHLYCAARDLPSKPGEPHVARIYTMYINSSRNMNVVTAVELTVIDQFLPPLAKPSC